MKSGIGEVVFPTVIYRYGELRPETSEWFGWPPRAPPSPSFHIHFQKADPRDACSSRRPAEAALKLWRRLRAVAAHKPLTGDCSHRLE
jgi:hypothetical protein